MVVLRVPAVLVCTWVFACTTQDADLPTTDAGLPDAATSDAGRSGSCIVGRTFVDCGGRPTPALFCGNVEQGCRWVSDGKPYGAYTSRQAPTCDNFKNDALGWFLFHYGAKPWTRDRHMNLAVSVDSSLSGTGILGCPQCDAYWNSGETACNKSVRPIVLVADTVTAAFATGQLQGWVAEFEIDTHAETPRARLCLVQVSDSLHCMAHEPNCAQTGWIKVKDVPRASGGPLVVTFSAEFSQGTLTGGLQTDLSCQWGEKE